MVHGEGFDGFGVPRDAESCRSVTGERGNLVEEYTTAMRATADYGKALVDRLVGR